LKFLYNVVRCSTNMKYSKYGVQGLWLPEKDKTVRRDVAFWSLVGMTLSPTDVAIWREIVPITNPHPASV
jgi:hypothetical protein